MNIKREKEQEDALKSIVHFTHSLSKHQEGLRVSPHCLARAGLEYVGRWRVPSATVTQELIE